MLRITILLLLAVALSLKVGCENPGTTPNQANYPTIAEFNAAVEEGRFEYVINEAPRFLEAFPETAAVWHDLGWAYAKTDKLDDAIRCFNKALKLDPSEDNSYVGLGTIARRQGDNQKARKMYEKAIGMRPRNGTALASLLVIDLLEKKFDAAIRNGEKAWEVNQSNPSIPANLCVAYHYAGNKKKRDEFFEKAKSLNYKSTDRLKQIFSGELTLFPEDEPKPK